MFLEMESEKTLSGKYRLIKEGLESILENGPEDDHLGICSNLDEYLRHHLDDNDMYAYDFVSFNCVGWEGIDTPYDWPIHMARRAKGILRDLHKWEGDGLKLRQSLIKYLIKRIETGDVDESIRDGNYRL